jgi:hypothetical protein
VSVEWSIHLLEIPLHVRWRRLIRLGQLHTKTPRNCSGLRAFDRWIHGSAEIVAPPPWSTPARGLGGYGTTHRQTWFHQRINHQHYPIYLSFHSFADVIDSSDFVRVSHLIVLPYFNWSWNVGTPLWTTKDGFGRRNHVRLLCLSVGTVL